MTRTRDINPYKFILGTVLLFLSTPMLIAVMQQPQTTRQRAQTPPQPPQCTAAKGICTDTLTGCFAEETNVGKLDCGTAQTCCAAIIPPQCFAQKGVCVPSEGGCLANETNAGKLDCDPGRICCAINVPPQCKAKNGACILKSNDCFEGEVDAGQLDCNADQRCCATAPTQAPSATQAPTTKPTTAATATTMPTVKPTSQPTKAPTATPRPTTTATPTAPLSTLAPTLPGTQPTVPGTTTIGIAMFLHGIGNSGDNVSGTNTLSNKSPSRTTRQVKIHIENPTGTYSKDLIQTFTYNSATGAYIGGIQLGDLITGPHRIILKAEGYVEKTINEIIPAGTGGAYEVTLTSGDINGDNRLDALDYNAIINCHNIIIPVNSCSSTQKQITDLNDDGNNNGVDYNLFLREIAVR